jgi:hypothetical protein
VALLAPFERPLALRMLGEGPRTRPSPALYSPALDEPIERPSGWPTARGNRVEVAHFLAQVLLTDAGSVRAVVPELEASVDERVTVWSPCVSTTSRTELVAALLESDDAITEVAVSILGTCSVDATVFVEWHLEGRFNNPGFLNDDVLIEPSGALVEASGVLVVVFRYNRATHIRCYYDGLGLLEQVVRSPAR